MQALSEREKVAHLLRRFGLGVSEAELDYYGKNGLKGAIDLLLSYEDVPEIAYDPMSFSNGKGTVNIRVMQNLLYMRLATTQRPFEEKMTIFWHNHFATSAMKVENSFVMDHHISLLRTNCSGSFRELLKAVSKDPAMLYWLDNEVNVAGKPNENFAREVMELFTLGIGNYSEKDIQEAARAFTGWTFAGPGRRDGEDTSEKGPRRPDRFFFNKDRHDDGVKTVFGQSGKFEGDDILDILCDQPGCARFIAKKMWSWFAGPLPSEAFLDKMAKAFRDSGLSIRALARFIMNAPEFYAPSIVGKLVKTPVDFTISTIRQLGVGASMKERIDNGIANPDVNPQNGLNRTLIRAMAPSQVAWQATKSMGMELLYPPDVAGWHYGLEWISSATMIARAKWAESVWLGGRTEAVSIGGDNRPAQRGPSVGADAFALASSTRPEDLVTVLLSLFDVRLSSSKRDILDAAARSASGGTLSRQNVNAAARAVCANLFVCPEFQFC